MNLTSWREKNQKKIESRKLNQFPVSILTADVAVSVSSPSKIVIPKANTPRLLKPPGSAISKILTFHSSFNYTWFFLHSASLFLFPFRNFTKILFELFFLIFFTMKKSLFFTSTFIQNLSGFFFFYFLFRCIRCSTRDWSLKSNYLFQNYHYQDFSYI